jgi:hypothetical protein
MKVYDLFWSPTGQKIATVEASTMKAAKRKAPKPYSRYRGEIYAVEVGTANAGRKKKGGTKKSAKAKLASGRRKLADWVRSQIKRNPKKKTGWGWMKAKSVRVRKVAGSYVVDVKR